MGFNVKRILRIASDKHGRKDQPPITDTDSPTEDEVYGSARILPNSTASYQQPSAPIAAASTAASTATSSTTSLRYLSRPKDARDAQKHQNHQNHHNHHTTEGSAARGIRTKASRIGRSKASRDYFNDTPVGGSAASQAEPKLNQLFDELRNPDEDDKDTLGVESTMGYLTSLGLNPESGEIFAALELVQAPSLGEITRKGFVDGWKVVPGSCTTTAAQAAYVATLVQQFSRDAAYFKRVYRYTFGVGKEPDQRSMSLDNAVEFWRVLFAPPGRPWKTPARDWTELWIAFLREKWPRSVNRDMWNQTLEFAVKSTADESLSFWSEDGAWPSVVDDFVAWCRDKGVCAATKPGGAMETDC